MFPFQQEISKTFCKFAVVESKHDGYPRRDNSCPSNTDILQNIRVSFRRNLCWNYVCLVAIPFFRYARFGQFLPECSLNTLFGDDYIKCFAILSVFFVTPQIGVNVLYIYLFRYLSKKWGRIAKSRQSATQVSVIPANKAKVTVCTNICENFIKAEENRVSLNGVDGNSESSRAQKERKILTVFQVKTETDTKSETSKESSNSHETNRENDLSPDLRRNKMNPDFPGTRSYRKERDVLCTIGIISLCYIFA